MNNTRSAGVAAFDENDAATLRELRATVDRLDPCPEGLAERVKFALTVQALHAEVAELTRDRGALTRGPDEDPDQVRTMTFSTDSVSIMITVTEEGPELVRMDGWLSCERADVDLVGGEGPDQRVSVTDGRFVLTGIPTGSARLVVHPDQGRTVLTPTFGL